MSDEEDLPPIDEPSDDFASFDPAAYLEKRRQLEGRRPITNDLKAAEVSSRGGTTRGRRSRRGSELSGELGGEEIPVGLMGRILGSLGGIENVRLYSQILGESGPLLRIVLPIVGCLLLIICVAVCGGGYYLITTLTHR
ncbi:MAG: hypothetical protein ABI947_20060 [Chloroflexota bacterium]